MSSVTVGVDVAAETVVYSLKDKKGSITTDQLSNDPVGHKRLIGLIKKAGRSARVCLEWTGNYSFDLAMALAAVNGIEVMMANPRQARHFHQATMRRAKTDKVDASSLRELGASDVHFARWTPPRPAVMELRALSRRVEDLIKMSTQDKARLHAAKATKTSPRALLKDIEKGIADAAVRIANLEAAALEIIKGDERLAKWLEALCSIKGVGERSAVRIIAELAFLPDDLIPNQVAAYAGLDPKTHQSGTSVNGRGGISKRGNSHLRHAMFMPAMVATLHQPAVREFYQRLRKAGKKKYVGIVACMRRLLIVAWSMRTTGEHFNDDRFRPRGAAA